ncbi:MAG: tetratricopeptide repeat protein [Anaerolineae bacterium]|nr:tetratricopeptide repeat protein [Anaerolineae bacterium]
MNTPNSYTHRALELRAAEYYAGIRKPESEWQTLEDLAPQLAEFDHYVQAENYEKAAELINHLDTAYLFRWGQYAQLVAMRTRLQGRLESPILQMRNQGRLARAHHNLGQLEIAIALYQAAATLALENDAQLEYGAWLGYTGIAYFDQGRNDLAIQCYEQALSIARSIEDRHHESQWLGYLGLAYRFVGQLEKTVALTAQALTISDELGDNTQRGNWLNILGYAYRIMSKHQSALTAYQEALQVNHTLGNRRREIESRHGLGRIYVEQGQFHEAIAIYQAALQMAREIGQRANESYILGSMGQAFFMLGDEIRAFELQHSALSIAQEIAHLREEGGMNGRMGEIYVRLGELVKARQWYEQALNLAYKTSDTRRIRQHWIFLSRIALMQGTFQEAVRACDKAMQAETQESQHQLALLQGIVNLYRSTSLACNSFTDAISYCREILMQTATLYEPQYTLATAFVGQAICDPRWSDPTQRTDLLAPSLTEYRRALAITAAPGVVRDALRDLELIRAAGIEGLEPVFELLETNILDAQSTSG